MQRSRRGCRGGGDGASRRFSAHPLRSDQLGFLGGFVGKRRTSSSVPRPPTLSFIVALRDGGPPAIGLAVRPRSGRVTNSGSVVGPIRIEIKLTTASLPSARHWAKNCLPSVFLCLVYGTRQRRSSPCVFLHRVQHSAKRLFAEYPIFCTRQSSGHSAKTAFPVVS
jgi:hypothetical protein